jgi:multiple antibiotic resistance protein
MSYIVDTAHIFTFFFIMLGPVKMIIPYARATKTLDKGQLLSLSWKSALMGAIIAVAGGFIGKVLMTSWGVAVPVLMLGAGIVFFLFALNVVLPPASGPAPAPANDPPVPTIMQVVFPMILTPYGLAATMAFLASSADGARTIAIIGILLLVMVLNLICMIFVRPILKFITPVGMQIVFAILGIMMIGLALQIIVASAHSLGIISPLSMAG